MKHLFLAAALAFAPATAFAQGPAPATAPAPAAPAVPAPPRPPLPDANPALWVVRDADTTICLFGTFHLLDGRPWFNDEIRTAFDASNELVLEAIIPEDQSAMVGMIRRYAVDPAGRKLSDRLSPEQNAALAAELARMGAPAGAFDPLEPWYAAMTVAVVAAQRLGIDATNGPETTLSAAARARNIPIGELKGFEWQMRLFDNMPEPQQIEWLADTLAHSGEIAGKLAPMLAAWSSGDAETIATLLNEDVDDDPALHRLLFTDRNATWAAWIQERMSRPGTVFIAVGAGHLAGPDGVQTMLRARGLTATRVPHVVTAH